MSAIPGSEFIPAAFLLPGWFVRHVVALIEEACDVRDNEEEEATA